MSQRIRASHVISIDAPVAQCQRFFTPAGEELWVEGWRPNYIVPDDGSTEVGMVFTTGSGDEFTVWSLVDFDTAHFYARYARVTPALRSGYVEVRCWPTGPDTTAVEVTYTMTALTPAGVEALSSFEGAAFKTMIEGWRERITARLRELLATRIR